MSREPLREAALCGDGGVVTWWLLADSYARPTSRERQSEDLRLLLGSAGPGLRD